MEQQSLCIMPSKYLRENCYNTTECLTLDRKNDNENILRINRLKSEIDNSYYKYYQIDYYNWMSQEELDICVERMNKIKSEGFITEKVILMKVFCYNN